MQEIAKKNSRANLKQRQQRVQVNTSPSDRNLTVGGGRVDEQIAKLAGLSRDTVRKVEAIQKAVVQKPHLEHIIERARIGEISVNNAEEEIEYEEESDAQEKKMGEWRKLKADVMREDGEKCRKCDDKSHLDVYTIIPYHNKYDKENLETLCKDCHEIKMEFYKPYALHNSLLSIFQHLTGLSGKKFFRYWVVGYLKNKHEHNNEHNSQQDSVNRYIEEEAKNPYAKLRAASNEELISETRSYRASMLKGSFTSNDLKELSDTHNVIAKLLQVLSDFDKMILEEIDARKRKAAMEGA